MSDALSMEPDIKQELLAQARRRIPILVGHLPSNELSMHTQITARQMEQQEKRLELEHLKNIINTTQLFLQTNFGFRQSVEKIL